MRNEYILHTSRPKLEYYLYIMLKIKILLKFTLSFSSRFIIKTQTLLAHHHYLVIF